MTGLASTIAASGALIQTQVLAAAADNIARKGIFASKAMTLDQASVVAQHANASGAGTPATDAGDLQASNRVLGLGAKITGQSRNMTQGAPHMTNQQLDVMIQGRGYFVVTSANGQQYYTRNGNFSKDSSGQIVTKGGKVVSPGITIPNNASSVTINESGEVHATVEGADQLVGQLDIATFASDDSLREIGDNLYELANPNDAAVVGAAGTNGSGTLLQGHLEASNIETVSELIHVMEANTTHGFLMKIIEADKKNGDAVAQAA